MRQIKPLSDERLDGFCAYCGNPPDSRDHVPSKIFLNKSFPENLPVVASCTKCNQSFSLDEEYMACLLECTLCGTTNPNLVKREKIKKILKRKSKLRNRIEGAKRTVNGQTYFQTEVSRMKNVIKKLAYGHAKYENSEPKLVPPDKIWFTSVTILSDQEITEFFNCEWSGTLPEVGSRALERMLTNTSQGQLLSQWIEVQVNNYYYSVAHNTEGFKVRMLIWDYLIAEVVWE